MQIVSDTRTDSIVCYARVVHILDSPPAYFVPGVRPRSKAPNRSVEPFGPRGDMTFSGLVTGIQTDLLTLKSRSGEDAAIHLRPDTRFLTGGQTADAGNLRVTALVFVRCGKNLENQVEAYQVVWGEILKPEE